MHLFYLLFKDIKIFSIYHKVLEVLTIIWPFLGPQKQLHSLSQAAHACYYFFFHQSPRTN